MTESEVAMRCIHCTPAGGVCLNITIKVLTPDDLRCADMVKAIRAGLRDLPVSAPQIPHFLIDLYRDFPGIIANDNGQEEWLDTEAINPDCPAVIAFFKRQRALGARPGYFETASYPRAIVAGTLLQIVERCKREACGIGNIIGKAANDNFKPE